MMQMTIRKSINFPKELAKEIQARADEKQRSFSAQVVYDIGDKYKEWFHADFEIIKTTNKEEDE